VGGGSVGFHTAAVILHYDGTGWQDASPVIAGYLFGVTAISSANAWTVGRTDTNRTLIAHWNGAGWTVVPSPNKPAAFNALQSVAAVSPTDIWAVGYAGANQGLPQQTLIEHWNGVLWSIVPSPNAGPSSNSLSTVTAISATSVWTVGSFHSDSSQQNALLTEHWNGVRWTIVPAPAAGNDLQFTAVTSADASRVWAAGYRTNQGGSLIEQWTGLQWINVIADSPHVFLYGIAAYGTNSAWAVGGGLSTVTIHWNGTRWTIVSSPNGQYFENQLSAVTMPSAQSAWAVGYTADSSVGVSSTLIESYC
jgi:hypothetical protein